LDPKPTEHGAEIVDHFQALIRELTHLCDGVSVGTRGMKTATSFHKGRPGTDKVGSTSDEGYGEVEC